jgi:hypothetical protein
MSENRNALLEALAHFDVKDESTEKSRKLAKEAAEKVTEGKDDKMTDILSLLGGMGGTFKCPHCKKDVVPSSKCEKHPSTYHCDFM